MPRFAGGDYDDDDDDDVAKLRISKRLDIQLRTIYYIREWRR